PGRGPAQSAARDGGQARPQIPLLLGRLLAARGVAVTVKAGGTARATRPQGLTRESFEALLAQLDPDRERAGERYEAIRRKLVRLFEWRGCENPEDLADETFNRVARRMAEGVELRSSDPYGYFCGVAHLVYKEVLRRTSREHRALESGALSSPADFPEALEASDRHLDVLRRCLERLPR